MNKMKAALGGIVISSMVLVAGCGCLPNKPSKVSIDGIDLTADAKGNIAATRKGEPFTRCDDSCNILGGKVQVDSVKPVRVGNEAVVVVEFQVPVPKRGESNSAISINSNKAPKLESLQSNISDPFAPLVSKYSQKQPLLASLSTILARYLPMELFEPEEICGPAEPNHCCSFVYYGGVDGISGQIPIEEDDDCHE